MAQVFLSYDRDDKHLARHFVRVLEAAGHFVWWDIQVRSGAQFSKAIEEALAAADAVVVLWSRESVRVMWRTPLLRYWRTTGAWPDFCYQPDLPYVCKEEAAKLPA